MKKLKRKLVKPQPSLGLLGAQSAVSLKANLNVALPGKMEKKADTSKTSRKNKAKPVGKTGKKAGDHGYYPPVFPKIIHIGAGHTNNKEKNTQECPNCGGLFLANTKDKKVFCSPECKKMYRQNASFERVVGKRFGRVVVVGASPSNKGHATCLCECDCGKTLPVRVTNLLNGSVSSCGCRKLAGKLNVNWCGCGDISGGQICKIRISARNRGLEYSLTNEFLWNLFLLQDKKCALSGIPISFGTDLDSAATKSKKSTASLDRIDSKKGYINSNVQWVEKHINMAKLNLPNEKFIEMCRQVAAHNSSPNPPVSP